MKQTLVRKLLIVPILAIGIAVAFALIKNRSEPQILTYTERATTARVIGVPMLTISPRYKGNGNVKPGNIWNGIAQVSGKIIAVDPAFRRGSIVPLGQFLMQIDPTDYQLAIAEVETNIEAVEAQISEIEIQERNSIASLRIEKDSLDILQVELARKQNLVGQGAVSSSDVEREQRSVLAQRQNIQSLENTINLYPSEQRRLDAELARLKARLDGARLDLERSKVVMPFTGRIADVEVEQFQFVRQGDRLGTADAIDRAEIEVHVPLWRIAALVRSEGVTEVGELRSDDIGKRLGLTARVVLERDDMIAEWEGRVARFSDSLDPQTRTLGVIVEVDNPYSNVQPGIRPPLVKGMFVNVELIGRPRPKSLVVPRSAVHDGIVYVVGAKSRLERRSVVTGIDGAGYFSIEKGLTDGENIVVSDLIPAIEGMLLNPIDDPESTKRLIKAASLPSDDLQ